MTRYRRRTQGFTLIELMIAIAIIAILAAIALPKFMTARHNAYLSACFVNERNLATALESYSNDNHSYPDTMQRLVETGNTGHINSIPVCPSGANVPYEYQVTPDHSSYTIVCRGYHHYQVPRIQEGFPRYSAESGLQESI